MLMRQSVSGTVVRASKGSLGLALGVLTSGPYLIWPAGVVCVGCLRVSWSVLGVIRSAEVLLLHRFPRYKSLHTILYRYCDQLPLSFTPLPMFICGCSPLNTFYSLNYCAHIYESSSSSPRSSLPPSPRKQRRSRRRPKRAYIPTFPRPPTTLSRQPLEQPQCLPSRLDYSTPPASEPPTYPLPPLPYRQRRRSRQLLPLH